MLWTLLAMLLILVLAAAVVVYVAYPHRGEEVPHAPWLGEAIKKGVEALPTLGDELAGRPAQRRIPRQEARRDSHPDTQDRAAHS